MKHNYDRLQNAKQTFRNASLEQSSLYNLIRDSLNLQGDVRPRFDSLSNIREQKFGRKRAMTVDGPIREKYVPLCPSK